MTLWSRIRSRLGGSPSGAAPGEADGVGDLGDVFHSCDVGEDFCDERTRQYAAQRAAVFAGGAGA